MFLLRYKMHSAYSKGHSSLNFHPYIDLYDPHPHQYVEHFWYWRRLLPSCPGQNPATCHSVIITLTSHTIGQCGLIVKIFISEVTLCILLHSTFIHVVVGIHSFFSCFTEFHWISPPQYICLSFCLWTYGVLTFGYYE